MLKSKKIGKTAIQFIRYYHNTYCKCNHVLFSETRSKNLSRQLKSSFFTLTAFILCACIFLSKLPGSLLVNYLGKDLAANLKNNIVRYTQIWTKFRYKNRYNNHKSCYKVTPYEQIGSFLPDEYRPYYMIISIFSVLFLIVISRLINRYDNLFDRYFIEFNFNLLLLYRKKQTLSKKQIKALMERKEFLQNSIKNKKNKV